MRFLASDCQSISAVRPCANHRRGVWRLRLVCLALKSSAQQISVCGKPRSETMNYCLQVWSCAGVLLKHSRCGSCPAPSTSFDRIAATLNCTVGAAALKRHGEFAVLEVSQVRCTARPSIKVTWLPWWHLQGLNVLGTKHFCERKSSCTLIWKFCLFVAPSLAIK